MKNLHFIAATGLLGCLLFHPAIGQKKVSELTLVYDYSVGGDAIKAPGAENVTHTLYIKGSKSRSEMTNPLFSSTTIFDASTGFGVILNEVSGQKLLIRLNPENWAEKNKPYAGMLYKNTTETKEIAGYRCVKAVGQTKSGTTITVFYTKDLIPDNRDYDPAFKTLDGLPLEYEYASGDLKIRYRIARININPVPASKFDIPKSGYREMNYEESKKMNVGN
jgi:hypothetical protein